MSDTGKAVGQRLTKHYRKSAYGSYGGVAAALVEAGVDVTDQTVINYHRGTTSNGKPVNPATMDVEVMIGLARLYRVPLADLSPTVALRADPVRIGRRADLLASYAAWDSNPQPTDSVPGQLAWAELDAA